MLPSAHWLTVQSKNFVLRRTNRIFSANVLAVLLLLVVICIEFAPLNSSPANAQGRMAPTVDNSCRHISFSPDGNPFPLCPAAYPQGGNCVWWAWEQWHLLGYDLPRNWGNAADWIVDATRSGLPLGKTPRVGSIAVFPRGDGVWAFGPEGHVAFVTAVNNDATSFNVTYQNYGDPKAMYVGTDYNVSVINQVRFQDGAMRFIYFPKTIDSQKFAQLPGIGNYNPVAVASANSQLSHANSSATTFTSDRLALGLSPVSSDQEFNADFTGTGFSDLLLYDRQHGRLNVLQLENTVPLPSKGRVPLNPPPNDANQTVINSPRMVSLGDSITPIGHWGSSLDIHVGNFSGTGKSEILLYDRVTGDMQLISLTPQLGIKKHTLLPSVGAGWEFYVGKFNGPSTSVLMYKRLSQPDSSQNASTEPAMSQTPTPAVLPNNGDISNQDLANWEKQGLTASMRIMTFDKNFGIHQQQDYTLWHASWEVYVGRFVSAEQDGIFLYDRIVGEGRLVNFNRKLGLANFQPVHNLNGNWVVSSGDFAGLGRAQLLLYDPSNGNAQILTFAQNMSLTKQKAYTGWGPNLVAYVGHFGLAELGVMLYDPQAGQSTFLAFDKTLEITHQYTIKSWDQHSQILIGGFLDHSRCLLSGNCSVKDDDVLVLNRQTGRIEQYVLSFGRQVKVFDNRIQAFERDGVAADAHLSTVDMTTFGLVTTLDTDIRNEELY